MNDEPKNNHGGRRAGAGRKPSGKPHGKQFPWRVPADLYPGAAACVLAHANASGKMPGRVLADAVAMLPDLPEVPAALGTTTPAGEQIPAQRCEAYRVYRAPDGGGTFFCGEYATLQEAIEAAENEPAGLARCAWGTARAAGHCGGKTAPSNEGEESDEPESWHGTEGWHCVVRVTYSP